MRSLVVFQCWRAIVMVSTWLKRVGRGFEGLQGWEASGRARRREAMQRIVEIQTGLDD